MIQFILKYCYVLFYTMISIIIPFAGNSQFLSNNTIWSEANIKYYYQNNDDTLINSQSYSIIRKYSDDTMFHYSNGMKYSLLREQNKRIYWYDENENNDLLLYDFNLNQGDSIYVTPMSIYTSTNDSVLMVCELRDSIIDMQGEHRLRLKMKTINASPYYDSDIEEWIYGIGSSLGLFNVGRLEFAIMDQQDPLLYCCHKGFNIIFHNENVSNCHQETLNINDLRQSVIEIYPNPVQDILTLKSDKLITYISIYNIQGKIIMRRDIQNMESVLNLENLLRGVYFLMIGTEDSDYQLTKILKI